MGKKVFHKTEPAPRALDFLDKKPSPINTRPIHNDKIAARMRKFNTLLERLEQAVAVEAAERMEGIFKDSSSGKAIALRIELRRFIRTLK